MRASARRLRSVKNASPYSISMVSSMPLMMLAHMLERHWPRVTLKMVKLGALGTMLNLN